MFHKILLASDGSEHSKRAAEKAIEVAKCSKDSLLEIVYVIDGDQAKSDVLQNWNTADLDDKRTKKIRWVEQKAKESNITFNVKTLSGEPGPSIVKHANEYDFDLVVIGSRGLNTLQEFVLGSVSHKVAKRAQCPVMIVK
ncbi:MULTISPECIES: universal stress protein [unclassified Sutcliffiella]|uniref:universal stress protein n=1 Tax=unclassified Sutcliffiella TaxID=2837532 RepID=UPI0030D61B60